MKIKNLLGIGLAMFCTTAMAQTQVFQETFDGEQTKESTDVGYYEYINLEGGDSWSVADGVQKISNDATTIDATSWWRRAIKFRNLPLKEKTSYRLKWKLKGSTTYVDENQTEQKTSAKIGLMQGTEDCDVAIGSDDSYSTFTGFDADNLKQYSKVFYFADKAKQDHRFDSICSSKEVYSTEYRDMYFATFNIYNPGEFELDDVVLEEAWVQSVKYNNCDNGGVICVDFGYKTNAAELAATKSNGVYLLDNSCVKVTVNGEELTVFSVELKSDGKLYIFIDGEIEDDPEVTFTSSDDLGLVYNGTLAEIGAVKGFTETAELDEEIDDNSSLYAEATLESSVPAEGTFALPVNISEFSFTFDRKVNVKKNEVADAPKAVLSNGEVLTLKTTGDFSNILTFERTGADLAKGNYSVTLSNIVNEYGTESKAITVSFEVGQVKVAKTIYTDLFSTLLTGDNNKQPNGATIMIGGSNWTGGDAKADDDKDCRNQNITGKDGVSYTALYLCDRSGYTYMQYGDKDDYKISLPKGNIEFSLYAMSHNSSSESRNVEFRIEDANGTELGSGSYVTTIGTDNFTTPDAANIGSIKFENPADQNVILKVHNAAGAWEGCRVLGFKARSYVETEGDKTETETLATGNFATTTVDYIPDHGTGWKIYRSETVMRDPGTNANWGGTDWTGGGGPRVKHPGNKGFNGGAIYLADGTFSTYGEYLYQTDHTGTLEPQVEEKTLTLNPAKYQITYYILAWKEASTNSHIKLEIIPQEEGRAGTPVYTRTDAVTDHSGAGADASKEAKKIQFFWTPTEAGKYILKFTSTDESLFGNVSVQTTASLAIQYAQKMNEALEPAKEELALANADDKYASATRDALAKAIEDYTEPDFHTAAEYDNAIANVEALVKKSSTRRSNIDKYPSYVANIEALMSEVAGTKYENIEAYKALNEVYSQYKDVNPSAIADDDELTETTNKLNNYYTWMNNMYKTGIALLTKQTDDLAANLKKLDATKENDPSVLRAKESIKDDQKLAYILKLKNLKAIYDSCAVGDPFLHIDPELSLEEVDSLDLSDFIQNANIYSTCTTRDLTDVKDIPGWSINIKRGGISQQWSWSAWSGSEFCPVNDVFLLNGWNGDFTMEQNVSLLPVGKYRYVSGTQDRGFADTSNDKTAALETMTHWTVTGTTDGSNEVSGEIFSYIYWSTGGQRDSVAFNIANQGQWYSLTEDNSNPIEVDQTGTKPYGDLLIGTRPVSYQSSASVDNFKLYMTGKSESFDYEAGAKRVQALILGAKADVNEDGNVDINDVNGVINVICGGENSFDADVNDDGNVDINDVNGVINIICGGGEE